MRSSSPCAIDPLSALTRMSPGSQVLMSTSCIVATSSSPAAFSSYSADAVTWDSERPWFFSVLAPSSRQKRPLRRPDEELVVFGTGQRYKPPVMMQGGTP